MSDYDKIIKYLLEERNKFKNGKVNQKKATTDTIITGGINYDFASLYPSTFSVKYSNNNALLRKNKIKKIFKLNN